MEVKQQTRTIGVELSEFLPRDKVAWTMSEIEKVDSETSKDVTGLVIGLLNEYESIAAGVNSDIYDEKLVKISRKTTLMNTCRKYKDFIENQRKKSDKEAWNQLTKLANKWANEDGSDGC